MPPLSTTQARTVDMILTQVARGYMNAAHAWMYLFPAVPVMQRGGKIIEFGAEQFASINSERAPGATRQQVHFGHSSRDFALIQRALDGKVPREILEEAMAVPGIDYGRVAVVKTMEVVSLQIEIAAAGLATKASTYVAAHKQALAGAAQWSHADSEPAKAVEAAKETIATGIGREPNVMVAGPAVHRGLVNNPDMVDRIKHTEGLTGAANPVINEAKLAQYFDVPKYAVARAPTFSGDRITHDEFYEKMGPLTGVPVGNSGRDPYPQANHVAEDNGLGTFQRVPGWGEPGEFEGFFMTAEDANALAKVYVKRVAELKRLMDEEQNGITAAMMCEMFGLRPPGVLEPPVEDLGLAWGGRKQGALTFAMPREDARRLAEAKGWQEIPEQYRRPYQRRRKTLCSAGVTFVRGDQRSSIAAKKATSWIAYAGCTTAASPRCRR